MTGDETLADPVSSLSMAAGLLAQQPASANQNAETIACNAFEVIKYYVKAIEGIYAQFEACGMSLGLDDLLQGLANQYETYVYLLQQRSRTVSLNKSPIAITVMENKRMNRSINEGMSMSLEDIAQSVVHSWETGGDLIRDMNAMIELEDYEYNNTIDRKELANAILDYCEMNLSPEECGEMEGTIDDYLHSPQMMENSMNKRRLRKVLQQVINENIISEGKVGYGTGDTLADFSDHIMNAVFDALAAGHTEENIRAFFEDRLGNGSQGVTNAVEAGLLEHRK